VTTRLIGGSNGREGRLEVYYSGRWGAVCDDHFNDVEARVACNSLGFGSVADITGHFSLITHGLSLPLR